MKGAIIFLTFGPKILKLMAIEWEATLLFYLLADCVVFDIRLMNQYWVPIYVTMEKFMPSKIWEPNTPKGWMHSKVKDKIRCDQINETLVKPKQGWENFGCRQCKGWPTVLMNKNFKNLAF